MKIALIISSLAFGGAEKQAVIDANGLSKEHQVLFLAFGGGQLKEQLCESVEFLEVRKTNYWSTALRLATLLKEKQVDLVHAHLYAPIVIAGLSTLFHPIPVIINFHGHAYEDAYYEKLAPGLISRLPNIKKILFPAGELKAYYRDEKVFFPAGKELVFHNSAQFWDRQPYKSHNQGPVTVGYIGRIVPLKRINLLIQLARELRDEGVNNFKISIVGDGEALPAVKAEAGEKEVLDIVDFHGFQPDTQQYYQRFSIFALPSREECLSLSLIDAQMIGLPCVAFDVGGNRDIIEHEQSGFIVHQAEEFKAGIKQLILDRHMRSRMGRRAIEQSYPKFSQKSRMKKLESLYQSVIG